MQWINTRIPHLGGQVSARSRIVLLILLVGGYGALAGYNLGLPGLHYDEAREAGINALELLRGEPVSAFRDAALTLGDRRLPLMVQDYIGALNVYLVLPFLALTGVGVPNLRWPALVLGLFTLLLLERAVSEWWQWHAVVEGAAAEGAGPSGASVPLTWAGVIAVALLALSPSFVFWSRQGIFVTNFTQPLCLLVIWQGLRWWRVGDRRAFLLMSAGAGLALYAKLLAGWVLGPFALLGMAAYGLGWMARGMSPARRLSRLPQLTWRLLAGGTLLFLLGAGPLILFNLQTGGTLAQVGENLGYSYYGVDNRAWLANLGVRLGQVAQTLRGDHFWYLGGLYGNAAAPWLALVGALAVVVRPLRVGLPLLLAAGAVSLSLFTISDLFITHFALLHPLFAGVAGIGWAVWITHFSAHAHRRAIRSVAIIAIGLWLALDVSASLRYHGVLAQTGGLADHSDATYHVAYFLRYNGMGAPVALDWGLDAPVRFLSDNRVRPIEIFGYASPAAPDLEFGTRLALFLDNPANVYLLRSPEQTVFAGRRELFFQEAATRARKPVLVQMFHQRDGTPLFEVWRVE